MGVAARQVRMAIDELVTNLSDDRLTAGRPEVLALSDATSEICERWKINADGGADDAIFARAGNGAGCIAKEFARECISNCKS